MDLKVAAERLNKYIKPKSRVVGMRFFNSRSEAESTLKAIRRPRKRLTICQIINTARAFGFGHNFIAALVTTPRVPRAPTKILVNCGPKPRSKVYLQEDMGILQDPVCTSSPVGKTASNAIMAS